MTAKPAVKTAAKPSAPKKTVPAAKLKKSA